MAETKINISWLDINTTESGYKVYKSDSAFSSTNLPAVYDTLAADTTEYVDTNVSYGNTYYYMISTYDADREVFSSLRTIKCEENIYLATNELLYIMNKNMDILSTMTIKEAFGDPIGMANRQNNRYTDAQFASMDEEGNFYIAQKASYGGNNDAKLRKFSPNFEELWAWQFPSDSMMARDENNNDNRPTCSVAPSFYKGLLWVSTFQGDDQRQFKLYKFNSQTGDLLNTYTIPSLHNQNYEVSDYFGTHTVVKQGATKDTVVVALTASRYDNSDYASVAAAEIRVGDTDDDFTVLSNEETNRPRNRVVYDVVVNAASENFIFYNSEVTKLNRGGFYPTVSIPVNTHDRATLAEAISGGRLVVAGEKNVGIYDRELTQLHDLSNIFDEICYGFCITSDENLYAVSPNKMYKLDLNTQTVVKQIDLNSQGSNYSYRLLTQPGSNFNNITKTLS